MRRQKLAIIAAALVIAAGAAVAVWLMVRPSYDDVVKGCQKALAAQTKAGGEGKPAACKDVTADDYDALVLSNAIDDMPKGDRDMLDYYDDGSINGSIG